MVHAQIQKNLKNNERSQSQKITYCMIPRYMKWPELANPYRQKRLVDVRTKGKEGEITANRYTVFLRIMKMFWND